MKIGITCYPTFGGSGVLATELGLSLARKGHCVHFISYAQPSRLTHIPPNVFFHEVQVNIYPLFQYPSYDTALSSKMVDVTLHENLDLLHVHYAIPHATSAYLARQILKNHGRDIRVATTLHGTDITLIGQDPNYIPSVEFGIDQSDGVTAVSHFLKSETNRIFNIRRDIKVIHNFVDHQRFQRTDQPGLKQRFAPSGEPVIIHVSNFRPLKRVSDVIHMFREIRKVKRARLILAGDGPERSDAERLCRQLGIWDDTFFMGKYEAVEELLSIADVFVIPSETETFGLAALEAMACRVPVISSNVGGLPELNVHGKSGFLCELGNIDQMVSHALTILESPESLNRFREGAYQRSLDFQEASIVDQYEAFYHDLLKDRE